MARGIVLTNDVRRCIAEVYLENPNYRAPKIREEVIRRLSKVYPYADPGWPGLSIVQKELTKIRKRQSEAPPEQKGLGRPWSLGTLAKYDLPAEAVPAILEIRDRRFLNSEERLTIREAKWVVRLRAVVDESIELEKRAIFYAFRESICELSSTSDDTFDMDNWIQSNVFDFKVDHWYMQSGEVADSSRIEIGQSFAQFFEETILGQSLDKHELPAGAWYPYILWLEGLWASEKWEKMSKKERKDLVLRLQNWVKEHHQEFKGKSIEGILGDVNTDPVSRLEDRLSKSKEAQNERSHKKEVQE